VSIAGTVIVALPDLELSAAEIAVTAIDWAELVAAGGVNVTGAPDALVLADSVPAVAVQATPLLLASFVTVAVSVMELVPAPSTVVVDA
jgi:hypothetical protein